jgi:NADPH:quinone reductase-like Zn-dependent oxidoreductase
MSSSEIHKAVATVSARAPLQLIDVPTKKPEGNEIRIKVLWTASTPLDLHRADGGLLISSYPYILGSGSSGVVVEVGENAKRFKLGDQVFGFAWESQQEKPHQIFLTALENRFALVSSVPIIVGGLAADAWKRYRKV